MTITSKVNNYCIYLFALLVAVFVILKLPALPLPYFWDELGVYGQCAVYQYNHGISLMPASLPPELSRGHPLLFTFINAIVMKVFGANVIAAHCFQLLVAIVLLTSVYYYISRYVTPAAGLISTMLIAIQPIFFAQSVLVLPEVMLSLFCLLSMVYCYQRNYLLFTISASLAIMTKESAVVLPAVGVTWYLLHLFTNRPAEEFSLKSLLLLLTPYVVFVLFLLVQKQQNGWYFFPYHSESIAINFERISEQFINYLHLLFVKQGRFVWLICMGIGITAAAIQKRISRQWLKNSLPALLFIFSVGFLLFCSTSFWGERYALPAMVAVAILVGVILSAAGKYALPCLSAYVIFTIAYNYMQPRIFDYDNNMNYTQSIKAMQQAVAYYDKIKKPQDRVFGNFPTYFALSFPEAGYLKQKEIGFINALKDSTTYYIQSDPGVYIEPDRNIFTDSLVAEFKEGYAVTKIYSINKR